MLLKLLPLLFWPQVIRHLSLSGPSFHQRPLPSLLLILSWTRRSHAGQRAMIYNLQRVLLSASRVHGIVCDRATVASERLLSRAGNDEERARLLSVSTQTRSLLRTEHTPLRSRGRLRHQRRKGSVRSTKASHLVIPLLL